MSIKSRLVSGRAVKNFNFQHLYRTIIFESSNDLDLLHLNTLAVCFDCWFLSSYSQQYGLFIKNTPFPIEIPTGFGESRWELGIVFLKKVLKFPKSHGISLLGIHKPPESRLREFSAQSLMQGSI